MHQLDLHNNLKYVRSISPQAAGTTGVGVTGKAVARAGFEGVELIVGYGSVTATNATLTVTLMEGATSGAMTSVADANMIPNSGAEALASVLAGTPRTSAANKNVTHRIGYIGIQPLVAAKIVSTVSAGVLVHAGFILGNPHVAPVAS
jgi:hypothetical protein